MEIPNIYDLLYNITTKDELFQFWYLLKEDYYHLSGLLKAHDLWEEAEDYNPYLKGDE